jgi:molecular chaperone DnaJ
MDKDFYKELGVSSSASQDEIKKAYRKLARDLHPDKNPGDKKAEERFKAVSQANAVLSDPQQRKEYDEARAMFASGGSGGFGSGGGFQGGNPGFDISDLFGNSGGGASAGGGGFSDLLGGLFGGRGGRGGAPARPARGSDIEASATLTFREAALGATVPLEITGRVSCAECHGSGARPGTSPRVCDMCNGTGTVRNQQGAFGFAQPCPKCQGTGSIIDDPCPVCHGEGSTVRTRTVPVRVPAGINDGQTIRLSGYGEAGGRGMPPGDLMVKIRVNADAVFGRDGLDLTVEVPVSYAELALGATVSIPTLGDRVGVKIPAGTADGRVLRVRGRGIAKKNQPAGDLMVTVKVAVPKHMDQQAAEALRRYVEAEKASGYDPRSGWAGA